jgi:hypothetical protein
LLWLLIPAHRSESQRYRCDSVASTSWKKFSDNKFALALAEQEKTAAEQVG